MHWDGTTETELAIKEKQKLLFDAYLKIRKLNTENVFFQVSHLREECYLQKLINYLL